MLVEKVETLQRISNEYNSCLSQFEKDPTVDNFNRMATTSYNYHTNVYEMLPLIQGNPKYFNAVDAMDSLLIEVKLIGDRLSIPMRNVIWRNTNRPIPLPLYKAFLAKHIHQLKSIAKYAERQRVFECDIGVGKLACCIVSYYNELSKVYFELRDYDQSIFIAAKGAEWDTRITEAHFSFDELVLSNYQNPIQYDLTGRRKLLSFNHNMRLFMSYIRQGYSDKAYPYLDEVLKNTFAISDVVVSEICKIIT